MPTGDQPYLLEVRHPEMARAACPGQFVTVMSRPEGERIPLTVADFDRDRGTIALVVQAVGKDHEGNAAGSTSGSYRPQAGPSE